MDTMSKNGLHNTQQKPPLSSTTTEHVQKSTILPFSTSDPEMLSDSGEHTWPQESYSLPFP